MTTKVDICNNALDLIGQGIHIKGFDDQTKEADLCRRNYQQIVDRCLTKFNFSFARKDELITNSYLVSDVVSIPYKYTYKIPSDVMNILYLERYSKSKDETINNKDTIKFNFRVVKINNVPTRCIVTNIEAPFVIQYQAFIDDPNLFSVQFTEAVEYMLGARLASALIHGSTGLNTSNNLMQNALMLLQLAIGQDNQQGADSIQDDAIPEFISARF
jgi:hypothetical protein